jgi:hypothetical protein
MRGPQKEVLNKGTYGPDLITLKLVTSKNLYLVVNRFGRISVIIL